ncbi:hypothetical protein K8T06_13180 [bacterium]|nr:hypothetical protein [bacterium]
MKRIAFVGMMLLTLVIQFGYAAQDQNAMDDIGFDSTFGYYKSANESINMQTGNVILNIPVSPVYPGPEGAGLDLQLNMVYNSNIWRYETSEHNSNECYDITYNALVDIQSMYYSSVGFGWRLHMGRLFRLAKWLSGGCQSIQYYYEDPSGATHDFGPYCEDEQNVNGVFKAQDGSGYVLQISNYDEGSQEIVMFDGTGRKFTFGSGMVPPILPNHCEPVAAAPVPEEETDRVFYVTEISDYNNVESIRIEYEIPFTERCNPDDPYYEEDRCIYSGHQISRIIAPFGRELIFHYDDIVFGGQYIVYYLPRLTGITMPGFGAGSKEYTFNYHDLTTISEPWGDAECKTYDGTVIPGRIDLIDQLLLQSIGLPENYSHSFEYLSSGEIYSYTNPLGANTKYFFKNVLNCFRSTMTNQQASCSALRIYWHPSRFIWKKEVRLNEDDEDPTYVWRYAVSNTSTYQGNYDLDHVVPVTVSFSYLCRYGSVRPVTSVRDPGDNETIYYWNSEIYTFSLMLGVGVMANMKNREHYQIVQIIRALKMDACKESSIIKELKRMRI